MSKIVTIYCEGKRGSHDYDILDTLLGNNAQIKPIGGKKGANAIIEFAETGATKSDFACMFRDRDFDVPVPANEELTFDNNKTYFSYRTTIENYLFRPDVFLKFIQSKELTTLYGLDSVNSVTDLFVTVAKEIRYYQAVRHTLGKLRTPNTFGTTWIKHGSGHLPTPLDLDSCTNESYNLISQYKQRCNDLTVEKFNSELESFLELFNDNFFSEMKFLVYFQGKDFAKALSLKLDNFPLATYYKFAKENIDFSEYKDLGQLLRIVLEQKA